MAVASLYRKKCSGVTSDGFRVIGNSFSSHGICESTERQEWVGGGIRGVDRNGGRGERGRGQQAEDSGQKTADSGRRTKVYPDTGSRVGRCLRRGRERVLLEAGCESVSIVLHVCYE
jgi:hypothetical protein